MTRGVFGPERWFVGGGLALLTAFGAGFAVLATRSTETVAGAWLGVAVAAVVLTIAVAGVLVFRQCGRAWQAVAISPYSIAALTWLGVFVVRPLELDRNPGAAALALAQLGFRPGELTRAVALGGLGCAAWCLGYSLVLAWRPTAFARRAPGDAPRLSRLGTCLALAAGTLLWVALFRRQGGLAALRDSAVTLRTNQYGSFYGFIGVWIVQGVAVYAFAVWLRTRSRFAAVAAAAGAVLSVLAAVALQLRGLAAFAALAAAAAYVCLRPLSRRRAAVLTAVGIAALLVLGFAQRVRQSTGQRSLSSSVRLAARTPAANLFETDLSTYDNLVAIRALVPSSIEPLDGRTIVQIPGALVPRAVWPGKPYGIDERAAAYLYPGSGAALAISFQGEMYWNGGVPAVALGGLVLGLLFGLLASAGLRTQPGSPAFVLYAVAAAFTFAFLTRGLATMTENLVFALLGISLAIAGTLGTRGLGVSLRADDLGDPRAQPLS